MKLARFAAIAALLTLVFAAVGYATTQDHGRRLAGPFCVSLSSGNLRVIAAVQQCRPGEVRKLGQKVVGPPGPPGKDGLPGLNGKDGANGLNGAQGPQGAAGQVTVKQLDGDQADCILVTGSDGSSGTLCAPPPGKCSCDCKPKPKGPTGWNDRGYTKPT